MLKTLCIPWAAFCAALCLWSPLAAQDVTLRFADGSLEVSGPLLGFDGQAFRLDTRFGILTIAADAVTCEGDCPSQADPPIVRLEGSPIMAEVLMPALVDAFARSLGIASRPVALETGVGLQLVTPNDEVAAQFNILGSSTTAGFVSLVRNRADIVLADRHIHKDERTALLNVDLGDLRNPMRRRLVARQRMHLYGDLNTGGQSTPDIVRMVAPGGAPGLFVSEPEEEAISDRLQSLSGRMSGSGRPTPPVMTTDTVDAAFERAMSVDSGAVITAQSRAPTGLTKLPLSHGCTAGSADGAGGEAYPLMVHLWLYTAEPRLPELARAFLVFASGPEAQRVVDRAGFVDQRPRPIPLAAQGDRVARAITDLSPELDLNDLQTALQRLQGYDRLSTAFRFMPEGEDLTAASQSEAQSLAALLDSGHYDGRELLFLGMTDGDGAAEENREVAEAQAALAVQSVRQAMVTRRDRVSLQPLGLGELFPLACDDFEWGKFVNRRVEVWVGPQPQR